MKDPQVQIVLELLMSGHSVTARSLSHEHNIDRGPARIWEIKHDLGYDVQEEWVKLPSGKRIKRWYMNLTPVQTEMNFEQQNRKQT